MIFGLFELANTDGNLLHALVSAVRNETESKVIRLIESTKPNANEVAMLSHYYFYRRRRSCRTVGHPPERVLYPRDDWLAPPPKTSGAHRATPIAFCPLGYEQQHRNGEERETGRVLPRRLA